MYYTESKIRFIINSYNWHRIKTYPPLRDYKLTFKNN